MTYVDSKVCVILTKAWRLKQPLWEEEQPAICLLSNSNIDTVGDTKQNVIQGLPLRNLQQMVKPQLRV